MEKIFRDLTKYSEDHPQESLDSKSDEIANAESFCPIPMEEDYVCVQGEGCKDVLQYIFTRRNDGQFERKISEVHMHAICGILFNLNLVLQIQSHQFFSSQHIQQYMYKDIVEATHRFTEGKIGTFGTNFKAKIHGNGPYIIKKLHTVCLLRN